MYKSLLLVLFYFLAGCTTFKVVGVDPETGYFPGEKRATVTVSKAVDLDSVNDLVLVPTGDFTVNMVKNIGYFDEVITFEELENIIIKNDLTDQVSSVKDRIGVNKAAKAYRKFLWLRWDTRQDGSKQYQQLILTDPITLEDLFVCETFLDYVWAGVNDQANWYPMMNSLVDYIKENSETYGGKS
ncbi:hypothetical protein ACLD0W_06570 [Alloalcanivorax sp. C16-1]|uniref:hypothetical protein n=1 Tax=Alloalcanivorax sp. C16-1 TaxID=3390051 RepID=UPI003970C312